MKRILMMETGSFKVIGGAAKDTYKLYKKLSKRYDVDIMGDFSKIDKSVKSIGISQVYAKDYDLVWLNSIRDVPIADSYRRSHRHLDTKFLYVDRGNVLLNSDDATAFRRLLPKMIIRDYFMSKMRSWLDYYIAISADQYEHARTFFEDRTNIEYIMIAPHEEYKKLRVKKRFTWGLAVSRLDERQKKISFMIKGIARIKQLNPKLRDRPLLKIVGTGVDEKRYKEMVRVMKLQKNIEFLGFMDSEQLVKAYNNAGFVVSTSEWEGLSRSLLEAMACGLPLLINDRINTAISYNPLKRIVEDYKNGVVYRYADIEDFAEKFYTMYMNGRMREKLSAGALAASKEFSFQKVVTRYEHLIDSMS